MMRTVSVRRQASAKGCSIAVAFRHHYLLFLFWSGIVTNVCVQAASISPSYAADDSSSDLFDARLVETPLSEAHLSDTPFLDLLISRSLPTEALPYEPPQQKVSSYTTITDNVLDTLDAVRTDLARLVYQWQGIRENPEMADAWDNIDPELRSNLEYLLYQDPLTRHAMRTSLPAHQDTSAAARAAEGGGVHIVTVTSASTVTQSVCPVLEIASISCLTSIGSSNRDATSGTSTDFAASH